MPGRRRQWLVAAILLCALAAFAAARLCFGFDASPTAEKAGELRDWFVAKTNARPVVSAALFFALALAGCAAGLSRLAFAALAGVVFGKLAGAAIALPATVLGSWVVYISGRAAGVERVKNLLGPRARHVADLPGDIGWLDVVVARQIPLPAPIINLLLAAGGTRNAPFFAGTSVGYLPTTLVAVFLGHGASSAAGGDRTGFYTAIAATLLTAVIAIVLRKWMKKG